MNMENIRVKEVFSHKAWPRSRYLERSMLEGECEESPMSQYSERQTVESERDEYPMSQYSERQTVEPERDEYPRSRYSEYQAVESERNEYPATQHEEYGQMSAAEAARQSVYNLRLKIYVEELQTATATLEELCGALAGMGSMKTASTASWIKQVITARRKIEGVTRELARGLNGSPAMR